MTLVCFPACLIVSRLTNYTLLLWKSLVQKFRFADLSRVPCLLVQLYWPIVYGKTVNL